MNQDPTVVIISGYGGHEDYRAAARDELKAQGYNAVVLNDGVPRDTAPVTSYLAAVRNAHGVVAIIGPNVGTFPRADPRFPTAPEELTHFGRELRLVAELDIPTLVFVLHEDAKVRAGDAPRNADEFNALQHLRSVSRRFWTPAEFKEPADIRAGIIGAHKNGFRDLIAIEKPRERAIIKAHLADKPVYSSQPQGCSMTCTFRFNRQSPRGNDSSAVLERLGVPADHRCVAAGVSGLGTGMLYLGKAKYAALSRGICEAQSLLARGAVHLLPNRGFSLLGEFTAAWLGPLVSET
jgi:hypothetical protein